MISRCCNELLMDPALLQSFPEDEWMSIHGLPYMGTLHFCLLCGVGGVLCLTDLPELWGQARVDFVTNFSRKAMSKEVVPMAILVTDGVDEEIRGMVTTFFCSGQAKVETLGHTFYLSPVGITWASCSGDKDIHQLSLFLTGAFWPLILGCHHPHRRCLYLPVFTFLAVSMLASSILPYSGCWAKRERGRLAKGHPVYQGGAVGEFC